MSIFKQNEIQVMPNPVSDQKLTVSLPENMKMARGTLMDLNGKVLSHIQLFSGINSMNISLKSGMYLMNISGTEVNYTTKIVVN